MGQTLPQRLYLLCYSVDQGKFEAVNLQGLGQLLRAGALAELTLDGLLTADRGRVLRHAAEPPGDHFLAEVWRDVPEEPTHWLRIVHHKAATAEQPVRDQLAASGAVTLPRRRGPSPLASHHVTVNDPQQVLALRETVRETVVAGLDPAALPADALAMAVLPVECERTSVFTRRELREHRLTLRAFAERLDELVPGLRRALRDSFLLSRHAGGVGSAGHAGGVRGA
ncbi:GPP34 family phosphoprotein [Streptomyces sp. NPDC087851]|uniref:GOLPH3/VPS74 family protein n=1 Tax=Streptomyces sp. NPDC087851 TaxID=3365810 RepID=UPI00380D74D7